MRRHGGDLLIGVGIVHMLFGIVTFAEPLAAIGRAGLFNAIDPFPERQLAFWFLMTGVLLFPFGQLVRWAQAQTGVVPAWLGWELVAIGVVGLAFMPVSGFWLVLATALVLVRASQRDVVAVRG